MKYIFLIIIHLSFGLHALANIEITATVKNSQNGKNINGAGISVSGSNIGTITNADGVFTIKIPDSYGNDSINIERIGFVSRKLSIDSLLGLKRPIIRLIPAQRILNEITVKRGDAKEVIEEVFDKIYDNYPLYSTISEAFYRETVNKGRRFIAVTEGVMDIEKFPYDSYYNRDKVQLKKGRRLLSQKAADTIAVKLVGGPTLPIVLDIIKNPDALLSPEEINFYDFRYLDPVLLDGRVHYAIEFKPVWKQDYVMMEGVLYVDTETLTLSRAEYHMDMSDKSKVTRAILLKKPAKLHFTPLECKYIVDYKQGNDGRSHINYIGVETKFKCDWKKKLFSSAYTIHSEMIVVDRDDEHGKKIARKESFGKKDVFYDKVDEYWDSDFWNDYNIIEPTESLEKAVPKLKKAGAVSL